MKFLVDADLPNSAVEPFREHGFEAVHAREEGKGGDTDQKVADYANSNGFTMVTRDRDFGNPLLHNRVRKGVIILKLHNYSPPKLRQRLSKLLENIEPDEIEEKIVTVEEGRYRVSSYRI